MDTAAKEAMFYVFEVMDEISGGAMRRGWRDATDAEALAEWDVLPPDALNSLKQSKGEEWVFSYGAKMERIRKSLDGVTADGLAV